MMKVGMRTRRAASGGDREEVGESKLLESAVEFGFGPEFPPVGRQTFDLTKPAAMTRSRTRGKRATLTLLKRCFSSLPRSRGPTVDYPPKQPASHWTTFGSLSD